MQINVISSPKRREFELRRRVYAEGVHAGQPEEFAGGRNACQHCDDQERVVFTQFDRFNFEPVSGHHFDFQLVSEFERWCNSCMELIVGLYLRCLLVQHFFFYFTFVWNQIQHVFFRSLFYCLPLTSAYYEWTKVWCFCFQTFNCCIEFFHAVKFD